MDCDKIIAYVFITGISKLFEIKPFQATRDKDHLPFEGIVNMDLPYLN